MSTQPPRAERRAASTASQPSVQNLARVTCVYIRLPRLAINGNQNVIRPTSTRIPCRRRSNRNPNLSRSPMGPPPRSRGHSARSSLPHEANLIKDRAILGTARASLHPPFSAQTNVNHSRPQRAREPHIGDDHYSRYLRQNARCQTA